jgi:hypothetical protein
MIARRGEAWNDDDIAMLRQLAAADIDVSGIARRLGRTRAAVNTKARKLGIRIRT